MLVAVTIPGQEIIEIAIDNLLSSTSSKKFAQEPRLTLRSGGVQGDGNLESWGRGGGSVREAGEKRVEDGIPKGEGVGRNRK